MARANRSVINTKPRPFISTWRTSIVYTGSTADNQIKLPLEVAGTYNFIVNWGDGSNNTITTWNQAETTHTYPSPGDYTVTITGYIKGWDWGGGGTVAPTTGDMRKLLTITQWGCLQFVTHLDTVPTRVWGAFYGCTNLILTGVQDTPNFKGTISIFGFLRNCSALTTVNNINKWDVSKVINFRGAFRNSENFNDNVGNWNTSNATILSTLFFAGGITIAGKFTNGGSNSIANWDTSNVTDMSFMFQYQPLFNYDMGAWNTSNVTNMTSMFASVTVAPYGIFNNGGSDSIKNWDTSKVTTFQNMFRNQKDFNHEIGLWDISSATNMGVMFYCDIDGTPSSFNNAGSDSINNWNTGNVTDMQFMFRRAIAFNQPIGSWNTSKVANMTNMFAQAFAFNQDISNWDISLVTNFVSFMYQKNSSNYSAANYDALLIGWASRPVKPNINIDFATIKRTTASDAAKTILTSAPNNWTIADGGLI